MGKLSFIKEVVDMARSVPKFIYNHAFVLSLMRRFTRNKELRRPAITRFAPNFITLQSLLRCQFELKKMFVSDDWRNYRYSKRQDGRAIVKMVYSNTFWHGVEEACLVSEPIVKVLRLVDGEKPAMAYLYEAMDRAKDASSTHSCSPYKCGFDFDGEVMEGFHSCIHRMVPDPELRIKINRKIQFYRNCVSLFGFDDAIRERTLFMPRK
eukprot:PITA_14398